MSTRTCSSIHIHISVRRNCPQFYYLAILPLSLHTHTTKWWNMFFYLLYLLYTLEHISSSVLRFCHNTLLHIAHFLYLLYTWSYVINVFFSQGKQLGCFEISAFGFVTLNKMKSSQLVLCSKLFLLPLSGYRFPNACQEYTY